MRDKRTLPDSKKAAKPASSDTCRLRDAYFKISVGYISVERTISLTPKIFSRSLKGHGVGKIRLADLLKIHLGVEVDPQERKSSRVCVKCARFAMLVP